MPQSQDSYHIASLFLGYAGRFMFLIGVAVLLVSLFLHTNGWLIGALLLLVSAFMVAIAYALNLPA